MQISTTFSLLALTSIATAASTFGLVSIRSGSQYQYLSVGVEEGSLSLKSGDGAHFLLNDDGSLQNTDSKKYIYLTLNKNYAESDKPVKGFKIDDGHLTYESNSFNACPVGSFIQLSAKSCSDNSAVALQVNDEKKVTKPTSTKAPAPAKTTLAPAGKKTTFSIVSVRSGTKFQNAPIKKVPSHVHVFSVGGTEGADVKLTLLEDGSLVDQDNVAIYHDPNTGEFGNVDPFGSQQPTKGFSIKDSHLILDGKDNWKACPSSDTQFSLANNDCVGGTGIVLHVVESN